jgi:prepilin-type N-terminal cleavage/methylation domain-containing protein/uncharacterized repeat protein (TIGR02543 family)
VYNILILIRIYQNNAQILCKKYSLSLSRKFRLNTKSGFTLLEILLVVGIISLLAGIVIVAINPGKQLATVRNTERKSDIKQLNSAINQYYISIGRYPASIQSVDTLTEVCDTGTASSTHNIDCDTNDLVDLSILVPTYITSIPVDPQGPLTLNPFIKTANAATNGTGYYVMKEPVTSKLIVVSERAELGTTIAIGTTTSQFATVNEDPEPETCTSFTYTDWTPDPCENGTQTRDVLSSTPQGCTGGTSITTQSCDIPLVFYTLTYNANGGSGAPTSLDIEEGSTITLSATEPTRSGYTFTAWNTNSDGTGTSYAPSSSFTMPSAETTLWAVWEENELWTPTELGANLILWLDANDESTIQLSGSNVTNWFDKSGNDYNAVAVNPPVYSNNQLVFIKESNHYMQINPLASPTPGGASMFAVYRIDSVENDGAMISYANSAQNNPRVYFDATFTFRWNSIWQSSSPGYINPNWTYLTIMQHDVKISGSSYVATVRQDGTQVAVLTGLIGSTPWFDISQFRLGRAVYNRTTDASGVISEIVTAVTSTSDRQKMEGYLAHKWGLTANLPSGHPYKNSPPTK